MIRYRSDIDGLRAIAVVSVIGFHFYLPFMSGGFVGVDIFFVISGYLISSLILKDIKDGKFSLANFYERRARRILPALILVLIATSVVSFTLLYPTSFSAYGKSLIAATLSFSNFYFFQSSGYFAAPAESQPLLHTWSLAIEEQFYLVFPPLLLLLRRLSTKYLGLILGILAILSFGCSAVGAYIAPIPTFYLLHTRAWELLMGGLLALHPAWFCPTSPIKDWVAIAGITLIAGSIFFYSRDTVFPGVAALPPCLGAAMIIASGTWGQTAIGKLLSSKGVVFVGLISYSLYLWHWPIIVFTKQYLLIAVLSRGMRVGLLALTFALAILSWKFVEQPFRRGSVERRYVFGWAGAALGLVAATGLAIVVLKGMPFRFTSSENTFASYLDYKIDTAYRSGSCYVTSKNTFRDFDSTLCLRKSDTLPNVLLIGDSHAAHLWYGLSQTLMKTNVMQATATGCKPTVRRTASDLKGCADLMSFIFTKYLPANRLDSVILSANWTNQDLEPIEETLNWAQNRGIKILLVGPTVEYDEPLPLLLALSLRRGNPDLPRLHLRHEQQSLDHRCETLALRKAALYASAIRALCSQKECQQDSHGEPLQFDYGHLTRAGSLLMAQRFQEFGLLNR